LAFRRADLVFFQNPDDERFFRAERVVRGDQSRVIPGSGVDLDRFSFSEPPKSLRYLMVARLLADKGVREYVAAARIVKSQIPAATFSLLGGLDHENRTAVPAEELESWRREGVIEYLGSTADVRPFIRNSAVVVLPSYREGLPRTLLEAAAMGRPLIGTDVPGCREVVREGVTGFLCEARDANSLASAMQRFAGASYGDRARLGAHARAMVELEFDEALVVGAYLDAIGRRPTIR
jgi:glycosyltransferase involved in cell wall biosynthesis